MQKIITFTLGILFLLVTSVTAQEIRAVTEDGKKVILDPNGTWHYVETAADESKSGSETPQFIKPKSSTTHLKGQRVKYGLWYDGNKWLVDEKTDNPSAEFELTHAEGDRYVVIIPERLQIPLETLRIAAIANAKRVAPDIQIALEEKRVVNGHKILCMRMDAVVQGIPITYYNYYYSGKVGAIQIMTYTGQNLFQEYKSELDDLLNGFEVYP
jgi:hypothetical protein